MNMKKPNKSFNQNFKIKVLRTCLLAVILASCLALFVVPQILQRAVEPITTFAHSINPSIEVVAAPSLSWSILIGATQASHSTLGRLYHWVSGIIVLVVILAALKQFLEAYNHQHDGTYLGGERASDNTGGSARLITRPNELKRISTKWSKGSVPKSSGLIVGAIGGAERSISYINAVLYGAPGSGKTRRVLIPTVCQHLACGDSLAVLDPKGEVRDETEPYAREQGYKVVNLMFDEPTKSACWNPLERARQMATEEIEGYDKDDALAEINSLAQIVVPHEKGGTPYFPDTARNLFTAVAYLVATQTGIENDERNLSSVGEFISAVEADGTTGYDRIKRFAQELPDGHASRHGLSQVAAAPPEAANSVISTLASKLNDFVDNREAKMLWKNDYDLSALSREKTIIYVSFSSALGNYDRLVTALVSQLLASQRQEAKRQGGALGREVYFLLEEFAQIGRIERLAQDSGIMRGEGIHLLFVLQNKSQLLTKYSKEEAEALLGNCDDIVVLSVNDHETQKELSERIGYYSAKTRNLSHSRNYRGGAGSDSSSRSENESSMRRALISPDELGRWTSEVGLLLIRKDGTYVFPIRDLSKTFLNKMLGLGDKAFNDTLRAERGKARAVANTERPPIWKTISMGETEEDAEIGAISRGYDPLAL